MTYKNIQCNPVVRASVRDYELAALVGDDAVILGWTMADTIDRSDLLGFALRRLRRDSSTSQQAECRWLPNHRRFAVRNTDYETGDISTQSDPLQQFYFLDYAIECGCSYTYSVIPVRGTPTLKYFETPVTVTVQPPTDSGTATERPVPVSPHFLLSCPGADQQVRTLATDSLAAEVRRLTDQARSAVFLYSTVPLPRPVDEIVREVNSGRLLYGLAAEQEGAATSRRAHNTVHLSRPVRDQRLDPVRFCAHPGGDTTRYTSALVTDPWSRSPSILLWSDGPRVSANPAIETRLIVRDKRAAASLATAIFQAYTAGRLPAPGSDGKVRNGGNRNLEPDGRWSNIYFSRHAASPKYREREIFSGHP